MTRRSNGSWRAHLACVVVGQCRAHGELRPVVGGLVDEVRQADDDGQGTTRPEAGRSEGAAWAEHGDADDQACDDDGDQEAVVGGQPGDRARREPPPGRTGGRSEDGQHDEAEQQEVHRRGQQDVAEHERHRGERVPPRGERLGAATTAELATDQRDDDDRQGRREGGWEPQRPRLVGEVGGQPRQERYEWRLVDVAPRGRQHPEVELVAVVAVAEGPERQREGLGESRRDDHAPREGWSFPVLGVAPPLSRHAASLPLAIAACRRSSGRSGHPTLAGGGQPKSQGRGRPQTQAPDGSRRARPQRRAVGGAAGGVGRLRVLRRDRQAAAT